MSTINLTAHGLVAGQRVAFSNISPNGTGLDPDAIYFVLSAGLTANAFQVSEIDGGTPLTLSLAVTSASMQVVPETTDTDTYSTTYVAVTDPTDVMAPPTVPPNPSAPTVTSALVSGIVRLSVTLNDTAESKVRSWEVQVTSKSGPTITPTGVAATDLFTYANHGLSAGDIVRFTAVTGGAGITVPTDYVVIASGLTTNDFRVSTTAGGSTIDFTTDLTASTAVLPARPDWTNPTKITMPEGSTACSIPALGSTSYTVRVSATDVYGNPSAGFSTPVNITTVAGSDALSAALAALATDVADGIITTTKIADDSISTPKLKAGAVTADVLAATIVLASLIKTGADGTRRVEIDTAGVRLMDTDNSLIVNIPTNGDPVYIKGQVTADSLISQTAASFRTGVSVEGSTVATLQNGIAAPTTVPTLTASVDYLALTSTPSSVTNAAGIAYDSGGDGGNGSFWIACDPTVSPNNVAQEFAATAAVGTAGRLLRTIAATGSITTTTTTYGSTAHVADTAEGADGSTNSHITTLLIMPRLGNVTKVAAYFAGHNGSATCRVGLWDAAGNNLRESATFTAGSGGATGVGNSDLHNVSLSAPLAVAAGFNLYAGWRHTSSSDGTQWDRDDGSGKTTKSGDGTSADATGFSTLHSSSKPNVYITYTYDTDTRLETAPNIGIATDGTNIYTLDTTGVVWKYDRTTLAHVAHSSVQTAISGTKSKAGLFYDATANELIITTSTGTGGGVFPKFVRVTPSTLAVSSTVYSAAAGQTFSGTTDTFRGGARLADPLNASAATYWIATTSAVYAYTFSGTAATQTSNRDFGQAITMGDGLTYDGTQFRGYDIASPTKLWKFTGWDWTSASSTHWFSYAWYDSNATGGTHETAMGPRGSLVLRRRERVQVQTPTIPVGGTDDPNNARIYVLQNATDTGAGTFWLQITDALTSRYETSYTGSGTHDGAGTAFPAGTPAELKSAASGWSLKGDGSATFTTYPIASTLSAHVIRASNLTVTGANVSTAIPFNATDDFDVYNMHDPAGANPSRITVPIAGKYRVRACIHTGTLVATLPTRIILELKVNGSSATIGGVAGTAQRLIECAGQTFARHMDSDWEVVLAANDFVEIFTEHNTATSQTWAAADCTLEFMGT